MPKGQFRYWVTTVADPSWDPSQFPDELKQAIQSIHWKAEELPHCGWHQHAYVEFKDAKGGKSVSAALNQPIRKKGEKGGYTAYNAPRVGNQAQALGYVASDEWCRKCNTGDCRQAPWLFEEPHNLRAWVPEEHDECRKIVHKQRVDNSVPSTHPKHVIHTKYACEPKGTVGEFQSFGDLVPQGRGNHGKTGQGEQQDQIIAAIKSGQGRAKVFEDFAGYAMRYHAWIDKAFTLYAPVRRWMPHIYWLWGDAGTDKSRMARAVLSNSCYCKPPDSKWFDGYDGQEVLVLNDLRKSTFTYSYLLDMLDRYEFRVEVKGGYVPLLAKVIIITCSKAHDDLWAELGGTANENLAQLTRRIKRELHVSRATLEEKQTLVWEMRRSVQELRNDASWDTEERYGTWDGEGEIPEPPKKRLAVADTTDSSTPMRPRPDRRVREKFPDFGAFCIKN